VRIYTGVRMCLCVCILKQEKGNNHKGFQVRKYLRFKSAHAVLLRKYGLLLRKIRAPWRMYKSCLRIHTGFQNVLITHSH